MSYSVKNSDNDNTGDVIITIENEEQLNLNNLVVDNLTVNGVLTTQEPVIGTVSIDNIIESSTKKILTTGTQNINGQKTFVDRLTFIQGINMGGTIVNTTGNELNYLSGVTLGSSSPGKVITTDANNDVNINGEVYVESLKVGSLTATNVLEKYTSSPGDDPKEINQLLGNLTGSDFGMKLSSWTNGNLVICNDTNDNSDSIWFVTNRVALSTMPDTIISRYDKQGNMAFGNGSFVKGNNSYTGDLTYTLNNRTWKFQEGSTTDISGTLQVNGNEFKQNLHFNKTEVITDPFFQVKNIPLDTTRIIHATSQGGIYLLPSSTNLEVGHCIKFYTNESYGHPTIMTNGGTDSLLAFNKVEGTSYQIQNQRNTILECTYLGPMKSTLDVNLTVPMWQIEGDQSVEYPLKTQTVQGNAIPILEDWSDIILFSSQNSSDTFGVILHGSEWLKRHNNYREWTLKIPLGNRLTLIPDPGDLSVTIDDTRNNVVIQSVNGSITLIYVYPGKWYIKSRNDFTEDKINTLKEITASSTELNLLQGKNENNFLSPEQQSIISNLGINANLTLTLTIRSTTSSPVYVPLDTTHIVYSSISTKNVILPDTNTISVGHTVRIHISPEGGSNAGPVEAGNPDIQTRNSDEFILAFDKPASLHYEVQNPINEYLICTYMGLVKTGYWSGADVKVWQISGHLETGAQTPQVISKSNAATNNYIVYVYENMDSLTLFDPSSNDSNKIDLYLINLERRCHGKEFTFKTISGDDLNIYPDPGNTNVKLDGGRNKRTLGTAYTSITVVFYYPDTWYIKSYFVGNAMP